MDDSEQPAVASASRKRRRHARGLYPLRSISCRFPPAEVSFFHLNRRCAAEPWQNRFAVCQ
jgi:hypothetical protein